MVKCNAGREGRDKVSPMATEGDDGASNNPASQPTKQIPPDDGQPANLPTCQPTMNKIALVI